MTDTLRTRIAKVLYRCDYDLRDWEKATDVGKRPYYDDADVVIEELGLRQQVAGPDGIAYGKHRFVTDWIANE